MPRIIDADKLKQHYAWWENGTAEMTLAEAKRNFDVIIDVQPTVKQPQINATENMAEIVRCKDCIYYHKGEWYDDDVCKVHSNDDRGYCAWGERK